MLTTYRVRFTAEPHGRVRAEDVMSTDVVCELAQLADSLPAGAYVLAIEELAEGRGVHWSRWPKPIRPGTLNEATGRVVC